MTLRQKNELPEEYNNTLGAFYSRRTENILAKWRDGTYLFVHLDVETVRHLVILQQKRHEFINLAVATAD